jgi:hypothetical protein
MKGVYAEGGQVKNPVDFISDEQFEKLKQLGLINELVVRNFWIKKSFKQLRNKKIKVYDAIDIIAKENTGLGVDTIKQIAGRKTLLDKFNITARRINTESEKENG